jgi:hypothetical protein
MSRILDLDTIDTDELAKSLKEEIENCKKERKNINDNRKFKDNEIVYVNAYNVAEQCRILFVQKVFETKELVYALRSLNNFGTFTAAEECIFKTKEDAIKSYEESTNKLVKKYKEEIRTLEDLVKFPLSHCIYGGGKYMDKGAREVYKIKAKEITGIDIDC